MFVVAENIVLKIQNLDVYYGELCALKNILLNVHQGQIVAMIGSNGAGKSTLLQSISGILPKRSGEIWFYKKKISDLSPEHIVKLGLSQVPERRRLFGMMSISDNLLLGTYSWERKKRKEKFGSSLERVYKLFPVLRKKWNQKAFTLSGGEQQMLAIGRGLISRPKILLMDEPSVGIAPLLVKNIMDVISQLPSEGTSILLVEQNARAAFKIANYVYVLERGEIVVEGNVDEMYENENVYSAYLGS